MDGAALKNAACPEVTLGLLIFPILSSSREWSESSLMKSWGLGSRLALAVDMAFELDLNELSLHI